MFLKAETASGDECEHRQHAYKPSDGKHKYKQVGWWWVWGWQWGWSWAEWREAREGVG